MNDVVTALLTVLACTGWGLVLILVAAQ